LTPPSDRDRSSCKLPGKETVPQRTFGSGHGRQALLEILLNRAETGETETSKLQIEANTPCTLYQTPIRRVEQFLCCHLHALFLLSRIRGTSWELLVMHRVSLIRERFSPFRVKNWNPSRVPPERIALRATWQGNLWNLAYHLAREEATNVRFDNCEFSCTKVRAQARIIHLQYRPHVPAI